MCVQLHCDAHLSVARVCKRVKVVVVCACKCRAGVRRSACGGYSTPGEAACLCRITGRDGSADHHWSSQAYCGCCCWGGAWCIRPRGCGRGARHCRRGGTLRHDVADEAKYLVRSRCITDTESALVPVVARCAETPWWITPCGNTVGRHATILPTELACWVKVLHGLSRNEVIRSTCQKGRRC